MKLLLHKNISQLKSITHVCVRPRGILNYSFLLQAIYLERKNYSALLSHHNNIYLTLVIVKKSNVYTLSRRYFPHAPKILAALANNATKQLPQTGSLMHKDSEQISSAAMLKQVSLNNTSAINDFSNPPLNVSREYLNQAESLITFCESIFAITPDKYFTNLRGIDRRIILYKTKWYLDHDPHFNIMQHKKMMSSTIKSIIPNSKPCLIAPKEEIKDVLGDSYDLSKLIIETKTNPMGPYSLLYEICTAEWYSKTQPSVLNIMFDNEDSKTSNKVTREISNFFTRQPNCDIAVQYYTPKGVTITFLDILIGRNIQFKGNIILTTGEDTTLLHKELETLIHGISSLVKKAPKNSEEKIILQKYYSDVTSLKNNTELTLQARVVLIQEKVIANLLECRKIDPGYNPNMFAFTPKGKPFAPSNNALAAEIAKFLSANGGLHYNITDDKCQWIIKNTFEQLAFNRRDHIIFAMSQMREKDKTFCITFLKQHAPNFYEQYKLLLQIVS